MWALYLCGIHKPQDGALRKPKSLSQSFLTLVCWRMIQCQSVESPSQEELFVPVHRNAPSVSAENNFTSRLDGPSPPGNEEPCSCSSHRWCNDSAVSWLFVLSDWFSRLFDAWRIKTCSAGDSADIEVNSIPPSDFYHVKMIDCVRFKPLQDNVTVPQWRRCTLPALLHWSVLARVVFQIELWTVFKSTSVSLKGISEGAACLSKGGSLFPVQCVRYWQAGRHSDLLELTKRSLYWHYIQVMVHLKHIACNHQSVEKCRI